MPDSEKIEYAVFNKLDIRVGTVTASRLRYARAAATREFGSWKHVVEVSVLRVPKSNLYEIAIGAVT